MGRRVNAALRETWRARIAQQAASGLTVAAFCHLGKFSENSFYQWRRRLKDSPPGGRLARQRDQDGSELMPITRGSTLTVDGRFVRIPLGCDDSLSCLEVVLADETRLRVPAHQLAAWELTLQAVMNRARRHEAEVRHA